MDWLTFISSIFGQLLSWPVAILVIVLLFLRQIRELLPSLRHARFGDNVELNFGQQVEELEQKVEQAQLPKPKEEEPTTSPRTEAELQVNEAQRQLEEARREAQQAAKEAQPVVAEAQQAVRKAEQQLAQKRREARRQLEEAQERQRLSMLRLLADTHPSSAVLQAWREVEQEVMKLAERADIFPASRQRTSFNVFRALHSRDVIDPDVAAVADQLRRLRNEAAHGRNQDISSEDAKEYIDIAERIAEYLRRLYTSDIDDEG